MPRTYALLTLTVLLAAGLAASCAPTASAAGAERAGAIPTQPLPDGSPRGITGDAAVYHNGISYIIGGRLADSTSYSDDIYAYHHATGEIASVAKLPVVTGSTDADGRPYGGRQAAGAAVLGDKIYVFGGAAIVNAYLDPSHPERATPVPKAIQDIVEFNPATNTARTLTAPHQLPDALWGMSVATYGGVAFLFGGLTFDVTNPSAIMRHDYVIRFEPDAPINKVAKLQTRLPYSLQDASAATLGSRIYVFGGLQDDAPGSYPCPAIKVYNRTSGRYDENVPKSCKTDSIVAFNPSTETVTGVVGTLPYRAQFTSAAVVKSKAYILGGLLADNGASAAIVEFNPTAPQDSRIRILTPTLPDGVFASGVTTDGSVITMFGGRGRHLSDLTANITRVDPRPTAPWAPRSATAVASGGTVTLSWDPPAYDGDSPVTGYNVYRTPAGGAEVLVTRSTTLGITDTGTTPGAQYTYRITALNDVGESASSARASTLSETVAPGAVTTFEAFEGNNEVVLRWTAPSFDGGANITSYRIYRDESDLPTYTVPASQLEKRDTNVTNGESYTYIVKAVNTKGDGAASQTLRVVPKAVPPAPASVIATVDSAGVTVSWTAPDTGVKAFTLLRGTTPANLAPVTELGGTTMRFVDATAERGRTYYYVVTAKNEIGTSPPSSLAVISLASTPGAPVNVAAVGLEGRVRITWQAPAETGVVDPSILTYSITRNGRLIAGDVKGATYEDRNLQPNVTQTYTITTFNGLESAPSDPVMAAAKPIVNKAPVASLAILTSVVKPNERVIVDASLSNDPDGTISSYTFDWGDSSAPTTGSQSNASHVYARNGTFFITVLVKDNRNLESGPAGATVIVGSPDGTETDPDQPTLPTRDDRPGTGPVSGIPGPGVALLLAAGAFTALVAARHRKK